MSLRLHGDIEIIGADSLVKNLVIEHLISDPIDPYPGRIWFNTTDKKLKQASIDSNNNNLIEIMPTIIYGTSDPPNSSTGIKEGTIYFKIGSPITDGGTVLLIHSNTTSGSQIFTDSAIGPGCPHTITVYGDVQHSTSQSKFWGSSIYLDGNGDYLQVALGDVILSDSWTYDAWIYTSSTKSYKGVFGCLSSNNSIGWSLDISNTTAKFFAAGEYQISTTENIILNTWNHIALVKDGTNGIRIAVNGVFSGVVYTGSNITKNGNNINIGQMYLTPDTLSWYVDYMDEIRISDNIARWTSNFTPPTTPY